MKVLLSAVSILTLFFSITAFSGESTSIPVQINWDTGEVKGNMLAARSSGNTDEMIGCGRIVSDFDITGGAYDLKNYGFCQARDVNGDLVNCLTEDPEMLEVLSTISDYSFIKFYFTEDQPVADNYRCSQIYVSNQSRYLPLAAEQKEKLR